MNRLRSKLMLVAGLGLAGVAGAQSVPRTQPYYSLNYIRSQTARFQDVQVALAEGYVPASACDVAPPGIEGAMGIHFVRPDLLKIRPLANGRMSGTGTHTDFREPGILLYEPRPGGGYTLVGIENLVFADAWEAEGNTKPPKFNGRDYNYMEDDPDTPRDEAHNFVRHYDLHIWLYRENPNGMYNPWNPNVHCPGGMPH